MYVKTNESCTRGILRMSNIVQMPGGVEIQEFTEVDDRKWYLTEWVLDDEQRYRRLVCTQVEELLAMYRRYPLPEFEAVRQVLTQLQRAYSDVTPFNRPLICDFADECEPLGPDAMRAIREILSGDN